MSELHYSMKEFLGKFNQNETEVSLDKFRLGMALIAEENRELKEILEKIELALWNEEHIPLVDKSNLLKEMGDVIYVVNWLATLCGVDIQEVYDRVHISNMSKLDDNGKPVYSDTGKVLKSSNYKPAILTDLVAQMKKFKDESSLP